MGSLHGEGKGEGVWVLYKGERWWLSALSKEDFKNRKEMRIEAEFLIEKEGKTLRVNIKELELAD